MKTHDATRLTKAIAVLIATNAVLLGSHGTGFPVQVNGRVECLVIQPDDKILLSGLFKSVAGQPRTNIARLNPDGTVDETFIPGTSLSPDRLIVQPDGKILVMAPMSTLARLNHDGSLDTGFSPQAALGLVWSMALQPDGRVIVGGQRLAAVVPWGGRGLIRLYSDGSLDANFNADVFSEVQGVGVLADGQILAVDRDGFTFYRPDETAGHTIAIGYNGWQEVLPLSHNGALLLGGNLQYGKAVRVQPDGSVDWSFDLRLNDDGALAVQADEKLVAVGDFSLRSGAHTGYSLARLNADGSLDAVLYRPVDLSLTGPIALEPAGSILFCETDYAGGWTTYVKRLQTAEPAVQVLGFSDSGLTWLRSGGGPDVTQVTFQKSGDGLQWTTIGQGLRTPTGWQLPGVAVATGEVVRAWGFAHSARAYGLVSKSDGLISMQAVMGAPVISVPPKHSTNTIGTTAKFGISVAGIEPLNFQWRKDGINLHGADGPMLTVTNVQPSDAGMFSVVVSNVLGFAHSPAATLDVRLSPAVKRPPLSYAAFLGSTIALDADVAGQEPISYQWIKDQVTLPSATNRVLVVTDLSETDAGSYQLVVSNSFGIELSSAAQVTVSPPPTITFNQGQIRIAGSNVFRVVVEASSDLMTWTPIRTNSPGIRSHFSSAWSDLGSWSAPRRFYRLRID